jgi:hypothetical protein
VFFHNLPKKYFQKHVGTYRHLTRKQQATTVFFFN